MTDNNWALRAEAVSKRHMVYAKPMDRVKQAIFPSRRYYDEVWALRDVSLEVHRGEVVGIVGRNGSGKSTLLQILCGLMAPSAGAIRAQGRISALLELGSGFNPDFTGRENVRINAAILGLSAKEIDEKFDEIADFARIGAFIDRPVKTYSTGMVVRLAFAVAVSVDPDILVVDEALAVGDESFQRKCLARIENIRSAGGTILLVSHSARQIVEFCDRAVLLDLGEKLMDGKPRAVMQAYQRLHHAGPEEQERLRAAYKAEAADALALDPEDEDSDSCIPFSHADAPARARRRLEDPGPDAFQPDLVPESIVVYPELGARILSATLIDAEGNPINQIATGRRYGVRVKAQFLADVSDAAFTMAVKTLAGLPVAVSSTWNDVDAPRAFAANEIVGVTHWFDCHLGPGTYFINIGVQRPLAAETVMLHRWVDGLMFQVRPSWRGASEGLIDLNFRPQVTRDAAVD